ncbi:hypothetical protein [Alkalicoccus luteus]|uniref:hypothetical protein n=1 Tax=Alkalicoccus luteus TaxID=1237094 RepID=UPI004034C2C4
MKKGWAAALLLLLTACGEEEQDVITGYNLGSHVLEHGKITVFVEDNKFGTELPPHVTSMTAEMEEYEVEAYTVVYDDDTEIIDSESGERIENPPNLFTPVSQQIRVVPEAGFKPTISTNRENHVLHYRALLPAVRAQQIELEPLSLENIHAYVDETAWDHFTDGFVLALLEDGTQEAIDFATRQQAYHEELREISGGRDRWSIGSFGESYADAMSGGEVEFPSYFIYQEGEEPVKKKSIDEVMEYVEGVS